MSTILTRLLSLSIIYSNSPLLQTPVGLFSSANVAILPSPLNPAVPTPATVTIVPEVASTNRITLLAASAMYMFSVASTYMPVGLFSNADVAAPPSPAYPDIPVPATVVIIPLVRFTFLTQLLPASLKNKLLPTTKTLLGLFKAAAVAKPPSPLYPAAPVPARVLILPEASIFLILLFPLSAT